MTRFPFARIAMGIRGKLFMTRRILAVFAGFGAAATAWAQSAPASAPASVDAKLAALDAAAKAAQSAGDNAWMLTSAALVLMMTAPGLALFYGGLVRRKNILSVMMQCMFIAGMMSV